MENEYGKKIDLLLHDVHQNTLDSFKNHEIRLCAVERKIENVQLDINVLKTKST